MVWNIFPDPAAYPANRLFSLDFLRGLDMLFLTVISAIIKAGHKVWPLPEPVRYQLWHPEWAGYSAFDMIMPLFIFMCGAAVPLALPRLMRGGHSTPAYWKHVLKRFAILWVLGAICQGALLFWNVMYFHPYCNTLHAIGVGYVIAAGVLLLPNRVLRFAAPFALVVICGLVTHLYGHYEPFDNFPEVVERAVYRIFLPLFPEGSSLQEAANRSHTVWIWPTFMFGALTLFGMNATEVLRSAAAPWKKAGRLAALGAGLVVISLVLSPAVPCVKRIWTATFTFWASGWSCLLLAGCYVLTDIWKLRRGTGIVLLYGQFALLAYVAESYFHAPLEKLVLSFFPDLPHLFGTDRYQPFLLAVGVSVLLTALLALRRKWGILSSKIGFQK